MTTHRIVYEREYDNPVDEKGKAKPNKLLGKFKVQQVLSNDMYHSKFIGSRGGRLFLVTEHEVYGYFNTGMGGSRFTVEQLSKGSSDAS